MFDMHPTEPVGVSASSFSELLRAMAKTGFQGRKLGEAFLVWQDMLKDDVTIFLGLAGAMIPAGMRRVICFLIENRYVDVVVSTGANIFHDICEALGVRHYLGSEKADDAELFKKGVDRIYDVFVLENDLNRVDNVLTDIISKLSGTMSSREFLAKLAGELRTYIRDASFLVSAVENGVPVFCPCIADSSVGIAAMLSESDVVIDTIRDVREITEIVVKSAKTGVIYVGGGVPKNFIQQAEVAARLSGKDVRGHSYAVQFTADAPHWGGLSGASLDEGVSWGKFEVNSKRVQVHVDATIALPIVAHALREVRRERRPEFIWKDELEVVYK